MTIQPPNITTIASALEWAAHALADTSESAARDARILLCAVLEVTPEYLILYLERALTIEQTAAFSKLVQQRAQGVPVAYLLGRKGFYDIEVYVTPGVLIPRPETELLVEKAIAWATERHVLIIDVGTGSGAIALSLAKHLPQAHVTGIDISEVALEVARRSAEKLNLAQRVRWLQGNLVQPLLDAGETADLIIANLPYIPSNELEHLEVARHEPREALDGGLDGLDPIRQLLRQAPGVMRQTSLIYLEIGAGQSQTIRDMVAQHFPALAIEAVEQDLAGHDRVVTLKLA
ncbi:MAG: peptide chain release factor N(5)-glutamine methyltransferase [Anaerolineae bacterium]|nr:peptide chain release factor N(5)-glutamine methyltransferase [Anaerolineae bacterium]